jgi:hypothetical protein
MKMTVLNHVFACSLEEIDQHFRDACCLHYQAMIVLMMEAVSIAETSVSLYLATQRNSLADSNFYTRCLKNVKPITLIMEAVSTYETSLYFH